MLRKRCRQLAAAEHAHPKMDIRAMSSCLCTTCIQNVRHTHTAPCCCAYCARAPWEAFGMTQHLHFLTPAAQTPLPMSWSYCTGVMPWSAPKVLMFSLKECIFIIGLHRTYLFPEHTNVTVTVCFGNLATSSSMLNDCG